jgi:hypothetical protein
MKIKTHKPISINGLSGYTIKCASDVESYTFYGSVTLGAGFSIIADTSPTNGMNVSFWFRTAITPGGYAFNILGTTINPTLVAGYFVAFAEYFDGAWTVWCAGIPQVSITQGGIGSITQNANGDLVIAPLGIVNSMISASAAIDYSKLAALTASKILGSDGSGVISALDTATYPSLTELALVKGATGSPLQTQIAAVISSLSAYALSADVASAIATALTAYYTSAQVDTALSNYTTLTALASALTAYYTSTQVDSLLAAVQLNAQTYNVPLTANTTLTAASITNIVAFDSTGGGFTVYLPLISSLPDGYVVTLKQYGSNAVVFGANVSDGGFTEVTGSAAPTISLSSSGGVTKVQAHRATKLWVVI